MWGAIIGAMITVTGSIVQGAMAKDAAEDEANKNREAASRSAAFQRAESQRQKFTPMNVTPAPSASSLGRIGSAPKLPIDTGNVSLSTSSQPRMTAAERIRRRLQSRRPV